MKLVAHRINTILQLEEIDENYGVEIDLRDYADEVILQHDPFKSGERLNDYLARYKHELLILNIKSEGIEYKVLEMLKYYNITNYLFLDCSFPMIKKLIELGERKIALRFSEYEGIESLLSLSGKCDYVWIDCFTRLILDKETEIKLRDLNFKLILVSPELQGRSEDIQKIKKEFTKNQIEVDFICSKYSLFKKWQDA